MVMVSSTGINSVTRLTAKTDARAKYGHGINRYK